MSRETAQPRGLGGPLRTAAYVALALVAVALDCMFSLPVDGDLRHAPTALAPLLLAASAVVLLLRVRRPMTALVVTAAIATAVNVLYPRSAVIFGVALALHMVGTRLPRQGALRGLLVALVPLGAMIRGLGAFGVDPLAYLFTTLFFGAILAIAWLVGVREHETGLERRRLSDEIETRGRLAVEQERQRMARELHDILSHSVSAMMMQAAGARAVMRAVAEDSPDDRRLRLVGQSLERIETTGTQSLRELHRLLDALRSNHEETPQTQPAGGADSVEPTIDGILLKDPTDPTGTQPLHGSLHVGLDRLAELVDAGRRNGLLVETESDGHVGELDASVDTAAYRLVQESLTNALKHAGAGSRVTITQRWQPTRLHVEVRCLRPLDSPPVRSASVPGSGVGLTGLRERIELAGGTFDAGWQGAEFVTSALLPRRPAPSPPSHRSRRRREPEGVA